MAVPDDRLTPGPPQPLSHTPLDVLMEAVVKVTPLVSVSRQVKVIGLPAVMAGSWVIGGHQRRIDVITARRHFRLAIVEVADVVARASVQLVEARSPGQCIIAGVPVDRVVAADSGQGICARPSLDGVVL